MPPELLLPVSTKGPIKQALLPQALSSGPESGFCNQIFALVGWSCIARFRKVALILPNWTSHDHGGYHIPHEKLFQYEPIARRLMECCNITVYRSPEHIPPTMKIWRPSAHEGGALAGWRKYKTLGHAGFTELVEVHERAVFQGLVPVASLREKVDQTKRLLLGGGGDGGAPSYGCLHARIETDMIASWRVNLAGPPPSSSSASAAPPPPSPRSIGSAPPTRLPPAPFAATCGGMPGESRTPPPSSHRSTMFILGGARE